MADYSIFDTFDDGVQVIDRDMRYVYLNPSLLRTVNSTWDDIVGKLMVEKFPGIDQTEVYREIINCLKDGSMRDVTNEFFFPDGTAAYFELTLQPITDAVLIFSRDITARKRGEILLLESNKRLDHFAHIAAHDLRGPARRAHLLAEELVLEHGETLHPEAREVSDLLLKQTKQLLSIIDDFRKLSNLGEIAVSDRSEVDVFALAKTVSANIAADHPSPQAVDFGPPCPSVKAYPSLVELLLRNVLSNAQKYSSGQILFSSQKTERGPVFCLENPTTNPPRAEDIFLPFVSGDRSLGTGLGLAIVRKVIDFHRSKVWSSWTPGRFAIYFTLHAEDARHSVS